MRYAENPDTAGLPYVRITRPQLHQSLTVRPMVDTVKPFRMHRIAGRSIPCLDHPCPFCNAKQPLDNRIFVLGQLVERCELVFVDVPASHWAYFKRLQEDGGTLCNVLLKFVRLDGKENGSIGIRAIAPNSVTIRCFPEEWVNRVLERNFSSNTQKALLDLVDAQNRLSTIAQAERSPSRVTSDTRSKNVSQAPRFGNFQNGDPA